MRSNELNIEPNRSTRSVAAWSPNHAGGGTGSRPSNTSIGNVAVDLAEPLAVAEPPVISAADDMFMGFFMGSITVAVGQRGDSPVEYRYTTDGSEPSAASLPAGRPFTVSSTTTVKARGFVGDRAATRTV